MEHDPQVIGLLSDIRIGREEDYDAFLADIESTSRGIKTGIGAIDTQLRGLQGIVGILGGPKACKSTLALQIAMYNAKQGNPVLFVDRENGRLLMRRRIICQENGVSWNEFRRWDRIQRAKAWTRLYEYPFMLYTGAVDEKMVQEWLDAISKAYPNKKMVLVLDSLHKLPHRQSEIRSSIDTWLVFLDQIKLLYDERLTIVVTSEKRRGAYDVASPDGGKESGRIEYTLEQQLDLRREFDDEGHEEGLILECTMNRHGPCSDKIRLDKICTNPTDKWSFTFKLKAPEVLPI